MADVVINLASRFFIGLTLVLIPIMGWYLSRLIWHLPSLAFFARVPILTQLSVSVGVLLGLGVMVTAPGRPEYEINTILKAGGPWDMPWRDFLANVADPALYGYGPLLAQFAAEDLSARWMIFGVILVAVAFGSVMATLILLRGVELLIGLVGIVFLALVGQALTVYLVALVPYAVNTLNFWIILLALIVLQYYRYVGKNDGN